jgi:membrane fusion protein, multidrug efflux system
MSKRGIALVSIVVLLAAAAFYQYRKTDDGSTRRAARQAPAFPVMTAQAKFEDFPIRRRTIGFVESAATVVVKSRIESQVVAQQVKDGQLVKKGDLLFALDDREVRAAIARTQAQLAKDQATLVRTTTDLKRYQQLSERDAASQQRLDQAVADNEIAKATVEADRAQLESDNLRLSYTKIVAPIDGRVGGVRVTPGNLVSVNDPTGLVTITQVQPIRVSFTLPERDLAALRKVTGGEKPAAVRVYSPGMTEPLASGTLEFIDAAVDTASGTISAKAIFGNENLQLWAGMYVDVEIDLDVLPNTVVVPTVAIQSGQKGPFVFVAKEQKAEMRAIEFIGTDGSNSAIASGVAAGDAVVVEGQMRLTDGARITISGQPQSRGAARATP